MEKYLVFHFHFLHYDFGFTIFAHFHTQPTDRISVKDLGFLGLEGSIVGELREIGDSATFTGCGRRG
jgi:hypothetical protein